MKDIFLVSIWCLFLPGIIETSGNWQDSQDIR
jgi:hypothetical protein